MADERPFIGITTSFEHGEQRLHPAYASAVEASGGIPLLIALAKERTTVDRVLDLVDGLLVPGGPAVTEGLIGPLPDDIDQPDPARLRTDRWILEGALKRRLPILGICYGMQLLNAYFGGTIYADVETQCSLSSTHSSIRGGTEHDVHVVPDTWLDRLLGGRSGGAIRVNTRHIQAIAEPGEGFTVSAKAPDGVVEAIESEDGRLIGLQFHAERMQDTMKPVFDHLVKQAIEARARR